MMHNNEDPPEFDDALEEALYYAKNDIHREQLEELYSLKDEDRSCH